jgi:hypothetical protein
MRHKWRNIDEISWPRFIAELKATAPAHPSAPFHDVKDRLQRAMVMGPGLCIGPHCDCTCPELTGSGPSVCNRCGPRHARSLRGVRIQLAHPDDFDAVIFPIHALNYVNIPARGMEADSLRIELPESQPCVSIVYFPAAPRRRNRS